ncbi:MAG: hypothetical protein KY476_05760 [Planctomycetes bacterium]|nr:hypothetical protein [Planctomycetota bacterium]
MHVRTWKLAAALFPLLLAAAAGQDTNSFRYPRVYGATGRPYGPTQAHYQYERQYGRPWHGYGGLTAHGVQPQFSAGHGYHGHSHGGFGHRHFSLSFSLPYGCLSYDQGLSGYYAPHATYGYVPPLYSTYGPVYGYSYGAQPYGAPVYANPHNNALLEQARLEEELRWQQPLAVEPVIAAPRLPEPSTAAEKLKSIRAQAHGDVWFRKTEYLQAYLRYKQAIDHARDRAEPYFRLAMAFAALGRHSLAVRELKRGLELDPTWPTTGQKLDELFGHENVIARNAVLARAIDWVREDYLDPDRLFLLGVLMHSGGDERAGDFFHAAYRLSGGGAHLAAFLNPVPVQAADAGAAPAEQPDDGEAEPPNGFPGAQPAPAPGEAPPAPAFVPPLPAPVPDVHPSADRYRSPDPAPVSGPRRPRPASPSS